MLLSGDEIGRTQQGNNNAFCQDNEVSWLDWQDSDQDLLRFVSELTDLRRKHTGLRWSSWSRSASGEVGMTWLKPDGTRLEGLGPEAASACAVPIDGTAFGAVDFRGADIADDDFLILLNASASTASFKLPSARSHAWQLVLDTSREHGEGFGAIADHYDMEAHSLVCFRSEFTPVTAPPG